MTQKRKIKKEKKNKKKKRKKKRKKKKRKKEKRVRPFWVFECVIVYHFVSILKISFPPPLCACVYLKKKKKKVSSHIEKKRVISVSLKYCATYLRIRSFWVCIAL